MRVAGKAIAVVACRVFEAEIAAAAPDAGHIVRRENFEMGLHDQPDVLRARLREALARAEAAPAVEAVVLVYGLCGRALVGLAPRRCPLVVARVHDCIGLLLGGHARHAACLREAPGTYWYSPGWLRGGRAAGPARTAQLKIEYTQRFGADDAEALLEMERAALAQHTRAGYTDHRRPGDDAQQRVAGRCAEAQGWPLDYHPGDPTLLHDLLHGPWDDKRFLIVGPGECIAQSVDAHVMRSVCLSP